MVNLNDSVGNLLSKPGSEEPQEFKRQQVPYEDLTNFDDKLIDFSKQFCNIYAARIAELRETLIPRVVAKWGEFLYSVIFNEILQINIYIYMHFMIELSK